MQPNAQPAITFYEWEAPCDGIVDLFLNGKVHSQHKIAKRDLVSFRLPYTRGRLDGGQMKRKYPCLFINGRAATEGFRGESPWMQFREQES